MKRLKDGCIQDEFTAKISNDVGTLSMANTGEPNSGGSQVHAQCSCSCSCRPW